MVGGWAACRVVQSSQSENNSHEPGRSCSNFYDPASEVTGLLLPFSIHQSGRTSARVRGEGAPVGQALEEPAGEICLRPLRECRSASAVHLERG